MEEKAVVSATLTPKSYKDIYQVNGVYQRSLTSPKTDFTITTHLTEAQVQALLDRPASSVDIPQTTARSRMLDLAPTLIIASLVIVLFFYGEDKPLSDFIEKIILGSFSFLLTCLAIVMFLHGEEKRFSDDIEKIENTTHENRAAVADAYRRSWGIDEWSVSSGVCLCAAVALVIALNKLPKNRPSETD